MKYLKLFKFYKNTNKDKKKNYLNFYIIRVPKNLRVFLEHYYVLILIKFLILKSTNIYVLLIIFCPNLAQLVSAWWAVQCDTGLINNPIRMDNHRVEINTFEL